MKIGDLKIKNPFFLAPMHQINDIAFRVLCEKNGCGLTYTWLINPLTRAELILDDKPAVQIACPSEKGIKEFPSHKRIWSHWFKEMHDHS